MDPSTLVDSLSTSLPSTATSSPLRTADLLDTIRRNLPHLPPSHNTLPLTKSVTSLLSSHPTNLLLSHRAVAVLAHPTLCAPPYPIEPPIITAMEKLSMSAAFQHTAMAALQNAATSNSTDRDAIILAVVSAMRHHHSHSGILLRGADLIAYHLSQRVATPLTSTYRVASRIVVDFAPRLTATPQGASTALLTLVAAARHASSLAAFTGRPSSTARFSRGSTSTQIVDQPLAGAVVAAMAKHPTHVPVQVLGCEVVRVGTAGASMVARMAAKEMLAAGGASAIVAALQTNIGDVSVVDRGLVALRSLLLGGGGHGRSVKPGLNVDADMMEHVGSVVDMASENIALRDRDLSSAAAVLAMDVRGAAMGERGGRRGDGRKMGGFGRRIIRRILGGGKGAWYDGEYDRYVEEGFTEKGADPVRMGKDGVRGRGYGRSSFSAAGRVAGYGRGESSQEVREMMSGRRGAAVSARIDAVKVGRKASDGGALGDGEGDGQISLNKKWRSVSGRWNQRGRRGSTAGTGLGERGRIGSGGIGGGEAGAAVAGGNGGSRRERRGPLTLSGSEMANLTRQPSRIFDTGKGIGGAVLGSMDAREGARKAGFVSTGQEDFGF